MTAKEAYRILGLPSGTGLQEIKKRYRQLMLQAHPDANVSLTENCIYNAREINLAYAVLKQAASTDSENVPPGKAGKSAGKENAAVWNAPVNGDTYREREILHYAEDYEGTVLGSFCIAKGKYLWTTEEDFPLFLLSIYRCSKQLLDEIDSALHREAPPQIRQRYHTELAYLLAQQFIDGSALLKELAKEEPPDQDGRQIFYLPSMLEASGKPVALEPGESLHPSRVRRHKLYLKNSAGQELGYLSFQDDRLYYVVVPLFEQKRVKVRIQAAEMQPKREKKASTGYQNLHLWLKLYDANITQLPENLNMQIERLLTQYRQT